MKGSLIFTLLFAVLLFSFTDGSKQFKNKNLDGQMLLSSEKEAFPPLAELRIYPNKPIEKGFVADETAQEAKSWQGNVLGYSTAALMLLSVLGLGYWQRKRLGKIMRWAKANPVKTQFLIAGLQLSFLGLGLLAGYNYYMLGYDLPGYFNYIFSALMALGFLSVPFLPSKKIIVLPRQLWLHRIGYSTICLSAFMLMLMLGNQLETKYPESKLTKTVSSIDRSVFGEDAQASVHPVNPKGKKDKSYKRNDRKISKNKGLRSIAGAGAIAGAVLLIILATFLLCGGICLIVLTGATGSIIGVIGGVLTLGLCALTIWGASRLLKISKNGKAAIEKEITTKRDIVYLKNGGILKGEITSIVPNESLTIIIAGGSSMVVKMEDVLKMEKE